MQTLLLLACITLMAFAASAMLLMSARKQQRLQTSRIDAMIGPYRPAGGEIVSQQGIGRSVPGATFDHKILRLLRHDPRRRVHYVAPLAAVVPVTGVIAAALGFAVDSLFGSAGWLVLPLAWLWLCRAFHGWCEQRVQRSLYGQFPDALAMIVRSVRVGLPVVEAIRVVARESVEPTAHEFTALVDATAIGVTLDEALRDMAERNGLPEYRFFATALSLQSQTGGGLTETLENLADTVRKRVAARLRGHALAAEARMSAYILGALPIVACLLLTVMNPGYMLVMFTDPSGRHLLYLGIGFLWMGAFSMRTLIRRSLT